MLLRVRGVPPKVQTDESTGYLVAVEPTDAVTRKWLESVKLSSEFCFFKFLIVCLIEKEAC